MAYLNRKNSPEIELWNVSLLPTVKAAANMTPPQNPAPLGGVALQAPAVLSIVDGATMSQLAEAA